MYKEKVLTINNLQYIVFPFYYVTSFKNGKDRFVFINDKDVDKKKCKKGEIYLLMPTWVEMQDIYQSSSERNIMTKKYELNHQRLKLNKITRLCMKIIDGRGESHVMSKDMFEKMNVPLSQFILMKADEIIDKYFVGTGLSKGEEKSLSYECYKYYSAVQKRRAGKNSPVPPCPAPVLLMDICKTFNCTPDTARRISKRDIDMMMIAQEQEEHCKNPNLIGMDASRSTGKRQLRKMK